MTLKQIFSDAAPEDAQDFSLSESERGRQVKFHADFVFKRGRINLYDENYRVELYQDDLSVLFNFRRDTTLTVVIGNKSVGLNVIDLETLTRKELVAKQSRQARRKSSFFEEEKSSPTVGEQLDN